MMATRSIDPLTRIVTYTVVIFPMDYKSTKLTPLDRATLLEFGDSPNLSTRLQGLVLLADRLGEDAEIV